jgi:uncharacterized peroxidase-related enzyme
MMKPMYLPTVEQNPKPGPFADAMREMQAAGGEYPQIWHLFAFRPEATSHLVRFTQEIMRGPAPLTPAFRELIAAYTSARNATPFCMKSHAVVAAVLLERERGAACDAASLVQEVVRDFETSRLDEKEKKLFRFIDKVNYSPADITAEDLESLRVSGWEDEAIYYAITICALFNFYNRWVEASGVHPLSDEAHRRRWTWSPDAAYIRK